MLKIVFKMPNKASVPSKMPFFFCPTHLMAK